MPVPFVPGYDVAPPQTPEDVTHLFAAGWAWVAGGIVSTFDDASTFIPVLASLELTPWGGLFTGTPASGNHPATTRGAWLIDHGHVRRVSGAEWDRLDTTASGSVAEEWANT
jgi:hypothetical protein